MKATPKTKPARPLHIAIVGSRRFGNDQLVRDVIDREAPTTFVLVSGGARGPDTVGENHATGRGLPTIIHPARWTTPCSHDVNHLRRGPHGAYYVCAGFERNGLIVHNADVIFAFVHPSRTGGTEDTIRKAKAAGKPIRAWLPTGEETSP